MGLSLLLRRGFFFMLSMLLVSGGSWILWEMAMLKPDWEYYHMPFEIGGALPRHIAGDYAIMFILLGTALAWITVRFSRGEVEIG